MRVMLININYIRYYKIQYEHENLQTSKAVLWINVLSTKKWKNI